MLPIAIPLTTGASVGVGVGRVPDKQQRLQGTLGDLVAQAGVLGAALVSRDGIRVMDQWKKELWNKETFSAMSATLMGAAEIALAELGAVKTGRVIAETNKMKMLVVGATDDLLLVVLAEAEMPLERLLRVAEGSAGELTQTALGE